jgi:hypothetical protein
MKQIYVPITLGVDSYKKELGEAAAATSAAGSKIAESAAETSKANEKQAVSIQNVTKEYRAAAKEARNLAAAYGLTHPASIEAAQRAGELKDQIGDANIVIDAFSADSKFTAVAKAMQAAAGATSIVTGAMGLLGVESKDTQEMMLKLQSALALTQGIASIKEMGASFTAVSAIIKIQVIPSIMAMNAAQTAGVGLVLAAVAAIVIMAVSYSNAADAAERLEKAQQNAAQNAKLDNDALIAAKKAQFKDEELRIRLLKEGYAKSHAELELNKRKELLAEREIYEASHKTYIDRQRAESRVADIKKYYAQQEIDLIKKIEEARHITRAKTSTAQAKPGRDSLTMQRDSIIKRTNAQIELEKSEMQRASTAFAENSKEALATREKAFSEQAAALNQNIQTGVVGIAAAIGTAIASGVDPIRAAGGALLGALGSFMQQLGAQMITIGILGTAFTKAVASLQWYVAIPLGIALVAAGAALSTIANKGPGGGGRATSPSVSTGGGPRSGFGSTSGTSTGFGSNQMVPAMVTVNGKISGRDIQLVSGRENVFSKRLTGK